MSKSVVRGQEGLSSDAKKKDQERGRTARNRQAMGKLLRAAREERGLVLREVHERTDIKVPLLCDVEHGKRTIRPSKLARLALVLAVPPDIYARLFQLRERLPPHVERYIAQHPELWKGGETMVASKKAAKSVAKKPAAKKPAAKKGASKKTAAKK